MGVFKKVTPVVTALPGEEETSLLYDTVDIPGEDEHGGDLYLDGFRPEIRGPGEERSVVIPSEFLDAEHEEDGLAHGNVTARSIVQGKRAIIIMVERVAKALGYRNDGTYWFTAKWVTTSGVPGAFLPPIPVDLDFSRPKNPDALPVLTVRPTGRRVVAGRSSKKY